MIAIKREIPQTFTGRVVECIGDGGWHRRQRRFRDA
jgi:hypothetical protein